MEDLNTALLEATGGENIAETLAREIKTPTMIASPDDAALRHMLLPPGWSRELIDDEKLLQKPRRLRAAVLLDDTASFVDYINRHRPTGVDARTVWCQADWKASTLSLAAIIDDHAAAQAEPSWREHRATYTPAKSLEWERWTAKDRQAMTQVEFASFIEDNRKDIATVEGLPTGSQMFEMALTMEVNQDARFKSAIRLQSGGTQLNYIADDDAQTVERMQLFERFAIGIPVFWNGDAYKVEARLKYRMRDGAVKFWYELERPDLTFQAAAKEVIERVRVHTSVPMFFGRAA